MTLFMNDREVGRGRVEKTVPARFSTEDTFDVGRDTASPVSTEYDSPFPFAGTLKKVEISLGEDSLTAEEHVAIDEIEAAPAQARQ